MAVAACINEVLTDDELRAVLSKLERQEERDVFGLVCRRWLQIQSSGRRCLRARAGPAMLRRLAGRFSGLVELDLSQSASRSFYPGVTDADLHVIAGGFKGLRVLDLQNCKGISDTGLQTLGRDLPSLQSLDVSNCKKLTDKGLTAVASGCPNLKRLHLSGCKSVTDHLLHTLSKNCLTLEELGLASCTNITDSGLSSLASGSRHVSHLDLSKCSKIGDLGVCEITKSFASSLVSLKLLDCFKVGDESIFALANSCPNLEILVIGGCREVTNEAIKSLSISCGESLKSLRLDWCLNLTDSALRSVLTNCRHLLALDIGCCDKLSDQTFQVLSTNEFDLGLRVLKASCSRITVLGVGIVAQFCKELEYFDLRSCPNVTQVICESAEVQFPNKCKVNFDGGLSESIGAVDIYF